VGVVISTTDLCYTSRDTILTNRIPEFSCLVRQYTPHYNVPTVTNLKSKHHNNT